MKMFKTEDSLLDTSQTEFPSSPVSSGGFSQLISQQLMTLTEGLDPQFNIIMSPDSQNFLNLEETMDIANVYHVQPPQPVSPLGPPARTVFAGNLDFQVEISGLHTHKEKYLFSHQLNRIYVDMKVNFPVTFTWQAASAPGPMFVRATVVFSDASQAEKRVERCTQHTHDVANSHLEAVVIKNVLHSARELNTAGVTYCGDPSQPDSWLSVLVELPGGGRSTHAYQFVCKNSCPNGINRRAIDVIFTLEDITGQVHGRQSVGARVCSCPRRDKQTDESRGGCAPGKRRLASRHSDPAPAPQATPTNTQNGNVHRQREPKPKMARLDLDAEAVVELPQLQVVGMRPLITGLEVTLSMMEQAASLKRDSPLASDYARCIGELRKFLDDCKKH